MAQVDNGAWDGGAAMSAAAKSDDPAAAYAAICAGRREGDPDLQSSWALPHHDAPGDPPNADGVRNALSRLPQTDGLTNRAAAERHLQAHLSAINASVDHTHEEDEPVGDVITLELPEERLVSLSVSQRRIGLRIVPYDKVAVHPTYGPLLFRRGAFGDVDPGEVRLRMDHANPPTGVGRTFSDHADGAYMDFQLSRTQRADDQLTLAVDGVSRGASVGFAEVPGRSTVEKIDGMNVRVYPPGSAQLAEVSTTWQPTFAEAGVMYVLDREGKDQMTDQNNPTPEAPQPGSTIVQTIDYDRLALAIASASAAGERDDKLAKMLDKFEQMVELQRSQFTVPQGGDRPKPKLHDWIEVTLRRMRGDSVSPTVLKTLALDDVVTSDNPGLVPDVFTPDYDDIINSDRPFLVSTREIAPPVAGTSMTLPIITQRATAGSQAGGAEKGDLTTTATQVGTASFDYASVFGGADISIQMINRAERSFFDLLTGDLGMAYALDCDAKAIAALIAGYTDSSSTSHDPVDGGVLDPEDLQLGDAWKTAILSYRRAPDTIWLSATAVAAFIDAKSPLTNAPLYSNLAAAFTAAGGPGGVLSGLRPIYVPALDESAVDVIVGPSRAYVWAEDPARTLQVDVPSKAGRDIALVGGLFLAPRYADAFTTYTVAS